MKSSSVLTCSFSWNTALIPEEAESALEATHYFTEGSSSEGETPSTSSHGSAALSLSMGAVQEASSPTVGSGSMPPWWGAQHFLGQVGPCRPSQPLFLLHLCLPGRGLLPLPSTNPLLSLPASPLASDLDLFLPWEAQGQSLEGRGDPFASRLCLPLLRSLDAFMPWGLFGTSSCGDKSWEQPRTKLLLVGAVCCGRLMIRTHAEQARHRANPEHPHTETSCS